MIHPILKRFTYCIFLIFRKLFLKPNNRNPWFDEYLKAYHNCSYYPKNDRLSDCRTIDTEKLAQQQYIHFIRDAVYAFAHALHDLHVESCHSFKPKDRLCPKFKQKVFTDLVTQLQQVNFTGE